jgi:GH35 family endo-1,4-beta-xylanase
LTAGGALSGIGTEDYETDAIATGDNSSHNVGRMLGAMNNLAILGLPIELTEFGISASSSGTAAQNAQTDAQILNETMTLVFGNPAYTGFTMWGFWAGDVWSGAPNGVLYDSNWNITPAGEAYEALMQQWNTQVSTQVGNGGLVTFTGFYGDYTLTVGGKTYTFSLVKGAKTPPALTQQQ